MRQRHKPLFIRKQHKNSKHFQILLSFVIEDSKVRQSLELLLITGKHPIAQEYFEIV